MSDDFFDWSQYPELIGGGLPFEHEMFDEPLELEDEEGVIERPFLPLRDLIIYPNMLMPLFIGRDRSLAAVQAARANNETLITAVQEDPELEDPLADDIYQIGTESIIGRLMRLPDSTTHVLAQGRRRIEILEFTQWDPYIRVRARIIPEEEIWQPTTEALMRAVLALFEKVVDLNRKMPDEAFGFALAIEEPGWLADFITATLNPRLVLRQEMLETLDTSSRLQKVSVLLARELDVLEMEDEIHSQVRQEVDKMQREHFLREQLRVIQNELGESDIFTQELVELQEALEQKELPEEVRAKASKEIARLGSMPSMAPEVGVIRTYLDWIIDLPWLERSDDNLDVTHAAQVLDANHYALDKVKDRILEYIAVKKIAAPTMRTPILCFVGPPGTGKTSLGRSIAEALNREFIRVSLGGVRDEAEIRGHRRTYVGALPGRIIQTMRRAGKNNPLFMMDEIDKLGQDFRGDPAAALLEVLDPEQNNTFADHYLDLDFDLSNVFFITTANMLDPIPPALQDRMEVIEFPGYLEEEKLAIAYQFIIPRQLEEHGLAETGLRFDESALKMLIRQYTYEAGVRNLEREIASVCRKIARQVVEGKRCPKRITTTRLSNLLGPPKMNQELMLEEDEVGVVTGVAWTSTGGDIMFIEVSVMAGKGTLTMTGQLGDVMQESAQTALSYVRSQAPQWGIDEQLFEDSDIHIHLPEGAVPKDGPSAGVAMVTALISAFTNRPVRRDVGLTGEITLRGRILPVGGIREKALAARRAGLSTFIMPQKNENDLQNIPEKLRQDLEYVKVSRIEEALQVALLPPPIKSRARRRPSSRSASAAASS